MPTHAEKRSLPYTPEQLFALVADVQRYPEFLPWCLASRIRRRDGNVLYADLIIGFRMFREKFTSRVTLQEPHRIDVAYLDGPLQYLNNHWIFHRTTDGGTIIDFCVDFEFRSKVLQALIGALFNEAVKRMVHAFELRAHQLYGEPATGGNAQPNAAGTA